MKAKQAFKKVLGDTRNLITPDILRYGKSGKYFYELSFGEEVDFPIKERRPLYGVTVINYNDEGNLIRNYEQSNAFRTKEEAEEYIESLSD